MPEIASLPVEEHSHGAFLGPIDARAKMDEPLPVRLVAVADVRLAGAAGMEGELDRFYVDLLQLERDQGEVEVVYRAENFRVFFELFEGLVNRSDYRHLGIEVPSLAETEMRFIEGEIQYTRQKGLLPGTEMLVLTDPAGNWVQILEAAVIR
jgi:catechol 2,3-dioxygenase-like lactoylglutathione lyase family enzyme